MVKIKTKCAWCEDIIQDGPLTKEGLMSHGICQRCADVVTSFANGGDNDEINKED